MNRRPGLGLLVAMAAVGAYAPVGNYVIADVPRRQSTTPIFTRGGESVHPLELHKLARKNKRRRR